MTPSFEFDRVIHSPKRLAICALISTVDEAEFSMIRNSLDLLDSCLSKQLAVLARANYVTIAKTRGRGRIRTWVALTPTGRSAFSSYRRHLLALLEP